MTIESASRRFSGTVLFGDKRCPAACANDPWHHPGLPYGHKSLTVPNLTFVVLEHEVGGEEESDELPACALTRATHHTQVGDGRPYLFLQATRNILPGEWGHVSYGKEYWAGANDSKRQKKAGPSKQAAGGTSDEEVAATDGDGGGDGGESEVARPCNFPCEGSDEAEDKEVVSAIEELMADLRREERPGDNRGDPPAKRTRSVRAVMLGE